MSFQQKLTAIVDTLVGIASPRAGVERRAYRHMREQLRSAYDAASPNRPHTDWVGTDGSADSDIIPDLPGMRRRSRDLIRNNAIANAVLQSFLDNVVGPGLAPQAMIDPELVGGEERAEQLAGIAEATFRRWSASASADNRLTFYELQQLAFTSTFENGDVIALPLMVGDEGREIELAVELIEADRLDNPRGYGKDGVTIRNGVELGPRGQPVAYWIATEHPGEVYTSSVRKPREFVRYAARNGAGRPNVLHLYWMKRAGQSRGVPALHPVTSEIKDTGDVLKAEVIGSKIAACHATFITKPNALTAARNMAAGEEADGKRAQTLSPGAQYYLNPGEDVRLASPNRPGPQFDQFMDRMLLTIGAALGLPYELVARDFRKTNYSSARAALLEARRTFQSRQKWLAQKFCQPLYEMVLEEAWLKGLFPVPDFYANRDAICRARWVAPTWGMIDPLKELQAYQLGVEQNFLTQAEVCSTVNGSDWEEVAHQRAREKKKNKELDIEPAPAAGAVAPPKDDDEPAQEGKTHD